ncbi:2-keto-4-pentenoate hydratase [Altererythrobacter marinus]|uniref:2-keto-4-pentenoate hydratase n=1 Tax=Pelagerythrobacter marinus TaxID=538382 RepID=A0ABW9V0I3_9SPHN|nr:2-keto-4-pentenoate hydratase [Pelagerythrobacter marinus]
MGVAAREVAEVFVNARRSGRALDAYPGGTAPASLEEAYAVQDAALSLWDRPVGGWKVGKINPPDDGVLGANRLAGPILADTIVEGGDAPAAMPVFAGGFAAAEAEFMLRLAPPAPDAPPPQTNEEAMAWIDEVRIGMEIASSPYPAINSDGPCVTVSDHGNNAGLVLGAPVAREAWEDLASIEVALDVNGETVGRATTATMLDGPFGAARFLLANLARRSIAPQAGWWISSGAVTGVHEVAPGDRVTARFAGLGELDARIVAGQ